MHRLPQSRCVKPAKDGAIPRKKDNVVQTKGNEPGRGRSVRLECFPLYKLTKLWGAASYRCHFDGL